MARKKSAFIEERPRSSELDSNGHEIPDSRPLQPSLNMRREPTLAERIKAMVRSEHIAREAREAGHESFEEADDFDVGDDYDPTSPYEQDFDPEPDPRPQAAPRNAEAPSRPVAGTPEPTPPKAGGSA